MPELPYPDQVRPEAEDWSCANIGVQGVFQSISGNREIGWCSVLGEQSRNAMLAGGSVQSTGPVFCSILVGRVLFHQLKKATCVGGSISMRMALSVLISAGSN